MESEKPGRESAYEVVSFGEGWGVLSLLLFLASLATRQLLSLLPFRYQGYLMMPPLAVVLVPVLAALGLLAALAGDRRRGVARIGFLANLAVFVLGSVLVVVVWSWRRAAGA